MIYKEIHVHLVFIVLRDLVVSSIFLIRIVNSYKSIYSWPRGEQNLEQHMSVEDLRGYEPYYREENVWAMGSW